MMCFRGKIVQYDMRYVSPKRGERELFVSYFPIEGPGGVDRVACVLQDITERKEGEQSLKLFRALIDQSNDAVEVVDLETLRFLDVNKKSCSDLGYSREELLAKTVFDVNPYSDESSRAQVQTKRRESGFVIREVVHRRKDGSTFPVEVSLKRADLDRSYIVAVSRDISDRKRANEALRESEDRYRDLVEHSADLVCTHDLQGRLLSVNASSARALGYEVADLIQMPMQEVIAPDFREQFEGYLNRIRNIGSDQGKLCVVTRSGERRIWGYNNTLRTEGVPVPIVRGMARDITERAKAESALRRSELRCRLLFEKNVAGVSISSMDGEVLECNEAGRASWATAVPRRFAAV
jgi:PAS domain S-box-containing protein